MHRSASEPSIAADLARAASDPITLDISTTGRTSGEPRRLEIWMVRVGDRFVIGGTPGPRGWLANLRADSRLTVHLKDAVVVDLQATATEITDPDVRSEIWHAPITEWYRRQAPVDALIATSPLVEVVFD